MAGRSAVYKFGASDERLQHLRGNNLVMWSAIGKICPRRIRYFRLWTQTSLGNEGLFGKFKLSWGASETLLGYWRVDTNTGNVVTVPDRASGSQAALFRTLPVCVSRLVGSLAYRHIGYQKIRVKRTV